MPSRVGPRHAGQSAVEMAMGEAARAWRAVRRQATTARIVPCFIRFNADSVANT